MGDISVTLKDKNGTPTEYSQVRYLHVPDPELGTASFMRLDHCACYYGVAKTISDGVHTFTVKGKWFSGYSKGCIYGTLSDVQCKEAGEWDSIGSQYVMNVLFSHKDLKTGQTYYLSEI